MTILEFFNTIPSSNLMQLLMLAIRALTPIIALFVVWRCFTSFKKGLRRSAPVVIFQNKSTKEFYHVNFWENSIGRSKSCDVVIDDPTVSRDHAVLLRRKKGWFIVDTDSKTGTRVNGVEAVKRTLVQINDTVQIGKTKLVLKNTEFESGVASQGFNGFLKNPASPFSLVFLTNLVHFSMTLQLCFGTGTFIYEPFLLFLALTLISWIFYFISLRILRRRTFEVETIGLLLSGIGINLLAGQGVSHISTQFLAYIGGIIVFMFLIALMSNVDFVANIHLLFAIFAIGFFALNMVIGTEVNGSQNWIYIGSISIQPSELIKIAYIFVGASTLDKLQTKKNIFWFIIFSGICMGFLFIMRDFGSALIFFVAFLIIAFMRSGSVRTIALIMAVAVIGVFMIISFKPYVAQRFEGWGHAWDYVNSLGYQQTRTLTYIASGGLFGMGLGRGYLHYIAAGESDLVFGMLCEEQGLMMGSVLIFSLIILLIMTLINARKSRSTFYSIASCSAIGLLIFQACLNIFGSTDILPLTGVTLPFISQGGTSMVAVWGLLSFIKASDERTYGLKRASRKDLE